MNTTTEITIDALINQWQQSKKQAMSAKSEQLAIEKAIWRQLKHSHIGVFEQMEGKLAEFMQDDAADKEVPLSLLLSSNFNERGGPSHAEPA
ncbi:MAG: hypothetical protein U5L76_02400 [Patescibacteria group bacterium]|nr:hypothetical protein [Patescibacteria group bacterium]